MEWRLILSSPATGAANMAADHALLESVQAGGPPVLRLYAWDPHCLSLGRNQPWDRGLAEAAGRAGADLVRRPTGGAAVHHHHELTYAVAATVAALGSPRTAYVTINEALVEGLRGLGVWAGIAGTGRAAAPAPFAVARAGVSAASSPSATLAPSAGAPCFRTAAPGEVVVNGRKLVGSAQRYERRAILQHGSLLLTGDQSLVGPGLAMPITLREATGAVPAWSDLCTALARGFEARLGARLRETGLARSELTRVPALTAHYRSDDWTRRR